MIVEYWTENSYRKFEANEIRWDLNTFDITIGDNMRGPSLWINNEGVLPIHVKIEDISLETSAALAQKLVKNEYPKYIVTHIYKKLEYYEESYYNELKKKDAENTI